MNFNNSRLVDHKPMKFGTLHVPFCNHSKIFNKLFQTWMKFRNKIYPAFLFPFSIWKISVFLFKKKKKKKAPYLELCLKFQDFFSIRNPPPPQKKTLIMTLSWRNKENNIFFFFFFFIEKKKNKKNALSVAMVLPKNKCLAAQADLAFTVHTFHKIPFPCQLTYIAK